LVLQQAYKALVLSHGRLIIDAAQRGIRFSFKELFDYRDLF
jgi:hypothetical protein